MKRMLLGLFLIMIVSVAARAEVTSGENHFVCKETTSGQNVNTRQDYTLVLAPVKSRFYIFPSTGGFVEGISISNDAEGRGRYWTGHFDGETFIVLSKEIPLRKNGVVRYYAEERNSKRIIFDRSFYCNFDWSVGIGTL